MPPDISVRGPAGTSSLGYRFAPRLKKKGWAAKWGVVHREGAAGEEGRLLWVLTALTLLKSFD